MHVGDAAGRKRHDDVNGFDRDKPALMQVNAIPNAMHDRERCTPRWRALLTTASGLVRIVDMVEPHHDCDAVV